MARLQSQMTVWASKDGQGQNPPAGTRRVVVWYHDESTFYAHDRRRKRWVHKNENAKPYAKGEGHSLMVADFYSLEYGWLQSKDGKKRAQVLFVLEKLAMDTSTTIMCGISSVSLWRF